MNKILLSFGVMGVLAYCVPAMPTNAISISNNCNSTIQPYAAGLIYSYDLSVSSLNGMLAISGKTVSSDTMKSIGYKDIEIQRSSDGINWSKEKDLTDLLNSNTNKYTLNYYTVSVKGGYYYRVSCKHYAKESGLFGSSQSVSNTSNSVWID